MAHKFGEIDYDLKFPNGQQVTSEIDLVAAVMYMWGLDGKQARDKIAAGEFSEKDLQRAIDYWVEKTDGDRHWDEALQKSKVNKALESILSGKDIRSAIVEEVDKDLDDLGKDAVETIEKITGYHWDYDFEFGGMVCICKDDIPVNVVITANDNDKWEVWEDNKVIGTYALLDDAAEKAKDTIKKAEDEWVDAYFKDHPEVDPSNVSPQDLKYAHELGEEKSLRTLLKTALASCGKKMDDWWYNYASMWHDSCVGLKKALKQSSENIEEEEEYKNLIDAIEQARIILAAYNTKYKPRVDKAIKDYSEKWDISDEPEIENLNSELAALEKVASLPKSTLTDVNELSKMQNWF